MLMFDHILHVTTQNVEKLPSRFISSRTPTSRDSTDLIRRADELAKAIKSYGKMGSTIASGKMQE